MTRDDILRMAREAGGYVAELPNGDAWLLDDAVVKRFAALVAAHEREACAKVCEGNDAAWTETAWNDACHTCAVAIRARGEK